MSTEDRFAAIGAALTPDEPELSADDWDRLDLRERADLDPIPGGDLQVRGEYVEPGAWQHLRDEWTRLPPLCPVVPLGRTKGVSHLLDAMGDLAELKDSSSGKGPIGGVFAGRSRYLEWAWPRFGKARKGETPPVVGWEADDARQALTDACAFMGAYDPDRMHGRGAWQDDSGQLAYHGGDRVWIEGAWKAPGRHGGWIYPARPRMGVPWSTAVPDGRFGPLEHLREVMETWNWRRRATDPHLLVGWVCMAMLGGALDWRAMVFITAEPGSGKSTLLNLLKVVFGHGLLKTGNASGAYLYQKLGHDSIPVIIDELEAQAGGSISKVLAIIELIRTASSGDKIGRGSSEGIAREFECRSAFLGTSINVPPMRQQDISRFAILSLDPFTEATADPRIPWDQMEEVGRKLLRRMIDGWPRWKKTLVAFKQALIEVGNHDARGAEQFGALLAAAHIAEFDDAPTREQLDHWATLLKSSGMAETANKTADWRECLNHLMDLIPDGLRNKGGAMPTLGSRLASYRHRPAAFHDVQGICKMMGLTLSVPKGEAATWENTRLFIPGNHPETRKNYAGTTWEGVPGATGVWHSTLQRAPADVIWRGECGAGLDMKRNGVFVQLATAFPNVGEAEAEVLDDGFPM